MTKEETIDQQSPQKEGILIVDESGNVVGHATERSSGRLQKIKSFLKNTRDKIKKIAKRSRKSIKNVVESVTPNKKQKTIAPEKYEKNISTFFESNISDFIKNRPHVQQLKEKPKQTIIDELIASGWLSKKPLEDDEDEGIIEIQEDVLNVEDDDFEELSEEKPERDEQIGNEPRAGDLMNMPESASDLYTHPLFQPSVASIEPGANTVKYIRDLSEVQPQPIYKFQDRFPNTSLREVYQYLKNPEPEDHLMNRIIEWYQHKEFLNEKKRYVKQILGLNAAEKLFDFRNVEKPNKILNTDDKKISKALTLNTTKKKAKGLMKLKLNVKETMDLYSVKDSPALLKKNLIKL